MKGDRVDRIIERTVFYASLVLIVGLMASMFVLDWLAPSGAHRVEVSIRHVERRGGSTVVEYRLRNLGSQAVSEVQVEGVAGSQKVDQVFAHLPTGAARQGVIVFAGASGHPEVRVTGYQLP